MNDGLLRVQDNLSLLSYAINMNPVLREGIDLPTEDTSSADIGKIIMSNNRYKNAFINTFNVLALTVLDRMDFINPWKFTERGNIRFGSQVRELALDVSAPHDYKEYVDKNNANPCEFLKTEVPNIFSYVYNINWEKFWKASLTEEDLAKAFNTEQGLYSLITEVSSNLRASYQYALFLTDKYQLARRIVDGTIPTVEIADYDTLTPRQRVTQMKTISNNMTFPSRNYNPAGLVRSTPFDRQILIMSSETEAELTTEVLATSFFTNQADYKSRMSLVDNFGLFDQDYLMELFSTKNTPYVPFTEEQVQALNEIPAVLIDSEFFQDRYYAMDGESDTKQTEFYNPETLSHNIWLHSWRIFATSPFKNGVVFVKSKPTITSVEVNPAEVTTSVGQTVQLTATVSTENFANKSVIWSVDETSAGKGVTIDQSGKLYIPSDFTPAEGTITVTATSVYDNEKKDTSTITVS